ncbi:MAG: molybdopterin oxidoreductase family protein [Gammaproteobacteria bacterium]|nr:molybdopterin oxidoreductase family protein [Gammaproteobacteria bacterium]
MSTETDVRHHFRTCHLCEAICGVEIRLRGNEILSVRGDPDDPFSRGHICPKALGLKDVHEDPDRLRHPVRRTAGGWQRIGWDEAIDEVAERVVAIQAAHGNDAVALYLGNPTVHSYSALLSSVVLSRALRTRNRYSATSVDQLPHHLASLLMFGHQFLLPIPDIDRTDFLLVLGANPVASNGSLMTAPDVAHRLKAIRGRGGRIVVVDPRRSETAALADRHLFIRPGSDALLLFAMLNVLFEERSFAPGRLQPWIDGIEAVEQLAARFPPEAVSEATSIPAAEIRTLAREFASARSAACHGRIGTSTQSFGGLCQWLIQVLHVMTGNLDRPGGAMFTAPAFDLVARTQGTSQAGHFARRRTRVRGLPEFSGEFPVATLAEEMDTPGPGQVRALITSAGNPVLSTPNGARLERALGSLEFMASVDFYINETTRHANIILPPTFALERDHYDLIFHLLAIRNTVKYSLPLYDPAPDTRHDWQILQGIAARLAVHDPGRRPRLVDRLRARLLTPKRLLALGLRFGPRGAGWTPFGKGLTLARLARLPHGQDLGALEPCLPERLGPNVRIQLAPAPFVADVDRLAREMSHSMTGPAMRLIGRRDLRSNNSWMHNSQRLVKGPRRCTLLMHPADAARLGINDGTRVSVRSRAGAIAVDAQLSEEIMPGVVSLPHGWGHDRPGTRQAVASAHPGASINDLTDELVVDAVSGNAAFSGVPVTVESMTS